MAREERGQIGGTFCLGDELSPGICRHPTGRFCVIMPMRVTIPAGEQPHGDATADDTPAHQDQAAA